MELDRYVILCSQYHSPLYAYEKSADTPPATTKEVTPPEVKPPKVAEEKPPVARHGGLTEEEERELAELMSDDDL